MAGSHYENRGFQHDDDRPPAYNLVGMYPPQPHGQPPCAVGSPSRETVDTHHTGTPAATERRDALPRKAPKKLNCKCVLCVLASLLVIAGVVAVLLWYFLAYQCMSGRLCGRGGMCLSTSQWCDGVRDCPGGEDESECLRLHGTNFVLQSYSADSQTWRPVCAERWDDDHGREACEQIGYKRTEYVSSSQIGAGALANGGYMTLKPGNIPGPPLQLIASQSCSANVVSLRCIACGMSDAAPITRIVGGTVAGNGAWPWQVSLQIDGQHFCGGSVIGADWILSAAHCFQKFNHPRMWTVVSGGVRLTLMSNQNRVGKIVVHEYYNTETNDNDVALLRLIMPLTYSQRLRPVCLPNVGVDLSPVREGWITGWGAMHFGGSSQIDMMQAQVTIYNRDTCNGPNVLDGLVTETMICAGKLQGGVDSCQGDSGGPLVAKEGGVWWLAGDTSWGIRCAWPNKPGVYGNVTHFTNWILQKMQMDK